MFLNIFYQKNECRTSNEMVLNEDSGIPDINDGSDKESDDSVRT